MNGTAEPKASLVLPLDSIDATIERVGGKGASLARLVRAGLPVPPGFHITTEAYRRFVADNALQAAILATAAEASPDDPASLERAATRIDELFDAGDMPDDVAAAARQAYADLAAGPAARANGGEPAVAVRSSATAEDLPGMSFAGQQETFLNVRGEDAVLDAVRRCWASLWTARAIGYRARQGVPATDVSLAVVVQVLVPAEAAGVLFTAHPVTGARDEMLINAAWGLGESVVGGLVTPDTVTVDRDTGRVLAQEIGDKEIMTVAAPQGTRPEPVPEGERRAPVLRRDQVAQLTRLGVRIESLFGQPMDIEWASRNDEIVILQARPITALPEPSPAAGTVGPATPLAWTLPDPRVKYYRASVVELLPDPVSPLFATLGLPAWNVTMGELFGLPDGRQSPVGLTTINGYAYYGIRFPLSFAPVFLRSVGRIGPQVLRGRERWERESRPAYEAVVRRWASADLASTPAERLIAGAREILGSAARHYLTIQTGLLPLAYMTESLFTAVYERQIRRRNDPPAVTFLLGFESAPLRAEESLYDLATWVADRPDLAAFIAATPGARIAEALERDAAPAGVDAEAWPAFRRRFADHLGRFGHLVYDLDFADAVPADEPAPLLDELRYFLGGGAADPGQRRAAAAARREQATTQMLARLRNPRRALFRELLGPAQEYAPLREDALADVGLGWPVLRRMLRELGRRLVAAGSIEAADDVFWLTADELDIGAAALDASRTPPSRVPEIAERRATSARWQQETPPPWLPLRGGVRLLGVDWSRYMPARAAQDTAAGTINGIGTSPGRVTATARVIRGPEQFGEMQPGDILVARITTPAWTPLFALAAGVVTDIGGPLSHGSIVAREYHIPAVLGTGVATERIRSGDRIAVDGDAGTVHLDR